MREILAIRQCLMLYKLIMSSNLWQNYEIFMTADGSPTLVSLKSENLETMHNRAGALSETDWIYGEATRKCFELEFSPATSLPSPQVNCFSLGLGLGYNEMMFAALCIRSNRPNNVSLYSVESDANLIEAFLNFLENKKSVNHTDLFGSDLIYEQILIAISQKYEISPLVVKNFLTKLYKDKRWKIEAQLSLRNIPQQKFDLIYYDAFSSKTSPELWSSDFLNAFVVDTTDKSCVFASYAATGLLKRVLKENGFFVPFRAGFHGKRECTLAIRSGSC